MGLDQYAFQVNKSERIPDAQALTDYKQEHNEDWLSNQPGYEEFHYWRKHSDLQGFMENLWKKRYKPDEEKGWNDFNLVPVGLTSEDLDLLEQTVRGKMLPKTTGFFFGSSQLDEEEIKDDLSFIAKAREALADGKLVGYTSWW